MLSMFAPVGIVPTFVFFLWWIFGGVAKNEPPAPTAQVETAPSGPVSNADILKAIQDGQKHTNTRLDTLEGRLKAVETELAQEKARNRALERSTLLPEEKDGTAATKVAAYVPDVAPPPPPATPRKRAGGFKISVYDPRPVDQPIVGRTTVRKSTFRMMDIAEKFSLGEGWAMPGLRGEGIFVAMEEGRYTIFYGVRLSGRVFGECNGNVQFNGKTYFLKMDNNKHSFTVDLVPGEYQINFDVWCKASDVFSKQRDVWLQLEYLDPKASEPVMFTGDDTFHFVNEPLPHPAWAKRT